MARQEEVVMSSTGIPFPLGREEGHLLKGNHDGEASSIQGRFMEASAMTTPSTLYSEEEKYNPSPANDDETNRSLRQMHLSNASSASNTSSTQGESLPSIRNLLHSIGQGGK